VDGYDRNGKRYIRVIDYKSGTRRFSFGEVLHGLQLQLAVYLAAYLKAHPGSEPAAILYFTVASHMIGYKKGMSPEAINDEIFGEYRMSGAVSAEIDIIRAMDRGLAGRSKIIPVHLTGGGTEVSKTSAVLDTEGFKALIHAAEAAIRETAGRILRGEIAPVPLYKDGRLACERCECHPLCGRDARAGSRKAWRRQLPRIGEREALEEILRRNL
jgi:ATP-dependent helicase/nuclease subunit B